ncbi:carboxylesterase family protein, partial [Streptomyces yokosukanensis]|uniref:carboxylesterase family protein n=1 Tax=Streptomyces yokosukanensis TaxID=67386 RepID=UPI0034125494
MTGPPVVRTAGGLVRGVVKHGCAVFHSIPYAAAPVGPARFAAPSTPSHWEGIRDATRPGPTAPSPARNFGRLDLTPVLGTGPGTGGDYLTVTMNYRLGVTGWLDRDPEDAQGRLAVEASGEA